MIDPRHAIAQLVARYPDAIFVSTCGFITRDLLAVADRDENFYLVGSMGMAFPVGLGISIARPDRHVIVLDGDGSFAMNLGGASMVGKYKPFLTHAVLDNGRHESTGGQETITFADFDALGRGLGYDSVVTVDQPDTVPALTPDGPTLVRYICGDRASGVGPRLALTPEQLVARFSTAIAAEVAR